jgi:hypothetical protein
MMKLSKCLLRDSMINLFGNRCLVVLGMLSKRRHGKNGVRFIRIIKNVV